MSGLSGEGAQLLRQCAERMLSMAEQIEAQAYQTFSGGLLARAWAEDERASPDDLLACASLDYQSRRRRHKFLPHELLGEPGWDMLVDLFIASLQQRQISVSSACLASGVPQSTALRWLNQIERLGLVERTASKHDHRVVLVKISDQGYQSMTDYYSEKMRKISGSRGSTEGYVLHI